jgi:hypothetical protein
MSSIRVQVATPFALRICLLFSPAPLRTVSEILQNLVIPSTGSLRILSA